MAIYSSAHFVEGFQRKFHHLFVSVAATAIMLGCSTAVADEQVPQPFTAYDIATGQGPHQTVITGFLRGLR